MQQRVGLARAWSPPEILLMDEPFASVDAQTREVLQEELLQLHERERKTMIFITHSIDEAIILGDRVAVMASRPAGLKKSDQWIFPARAIRFRSRPSWYAEPEAICGGTGPSRWARSKMTIAG